ncbi:FAD-dependent oxidoreductase [Klenkia brasiliensis]|uniref:2,4-dichlorophenol 6-monooxygenase n=1 Tax=Klenkia brasiliensis TaxID=333142 RepID=A0A1G7WFV6_9ACTN|nr:FAD-dependent monooxygenase [Klenkia brasiliensis]SDG70639.1 2,4-dichlorophenol 6-monooxygenase [Klenkia brasiliensis]
MTSPHPTTDAPRTVVETDVLVVGSGPAGSAAALALATYGVRTLVITKYGRLADTPRAHITNQRTMEALRDLGVEEEVAAQAAPQELMGNLVYCTSLSGEELGRLHSWGTRPDRLADYTAASPSRICDMPQDLMEPVLLHNAQSRGAKVRFDTEYLSLTQDDDGVTVRVRDRARGDEYDIRARYVVGADGGRSQIATDVGLPLVGRMGVGGSINIVFEADLSHLVADRPSVLYWVLQPGADVGGIGAGLVRMVRPWHRWLIVWGYDIDGPAPDLTEEYALSIVRKLVGDDEVPVRIESSSAWTVNHLYAEQYSAGRVFCAGDAVHRHPPSNGLGSNTSIQDAYNLAWKLAAVVKGQAGPGLLETYSAERAPVGKQIVDRANQSIGDTARIFDALGLLDAADPEQMVAHMAARKEATPEAEKQRAALREAIAFKDYEFNCHGVEMDQRYASTAVVPDGTPPEEPTRDPELYSHPTSRPGAKVPHAWLTADHRRQVSTLDLVGHGRFTVLTGIGGEGWVDAAAAVGGELGLEVASAVVGPGRAHDDLYGDWARVRGTSDGGALLVRPDGYVAARWAGPVDDATGALGAALRTVLDRA